jgi:hypothetical protein
MGKERLNRINQNKSGLAREDYSHITTNITIINIKIKLPEGDLIIDSLTISLIAMK